MFLSNYQAYTIHNMSRNDYVNTWQGAVQIEVVPFVGGPVVGGGVAAPGTVILTLLYSDYKAWLLGSCNATTMITSTTASSQIRLLLMWTYVVQQLNESFQNIPSYQTPLAPLAGEMVSKFMRKVM